MTSKDRGHKSGSAPEKKHAKAHRSAKRAPPAEARKPVEAPPEKPREPEPEDIEEPIVAPPPPEPEPAPPSFVPTPEPSPVPEPVPAPGATMTPEPTPTPAAATPAPAPSAPAAPAPQWQPMPEAKPAEATVAVSADEWTERASTRRGQPVAQAAGWATAILGMLLLAVAYYRGYQTKVLPAPAGLRLDYIAAALLLIGIALAAVFAFAPSRSATGIRTDANDEDLRARAARAHQRLRTAQVLTGVGLGVVFVGLLWLFHWVRIGFLEGAFRQSAVRTYSVPTHYFGAILVVLGLLILFAFWARVGPARRERAYAVLALKRSAAASAAPANTLSGVTEAELQALMRRLDGLMAQLPDAAVTDFSKSPEADTYLKLLGS